ncbi:MAG: hypothetical protein GY937_18550 [bacterium]|nr:hypothetical protein [bacterium]
MKSFQRLQQTILRYTPVSFQNLALSARGYQINRFRYTAHFERRLAELEATANAPIEALHQIQRDRLVERVEWARKNTRVFSNLPPPSTRADPVEAIRETLASIESPQKSQYAERLDDFIGSDLDRSSLIKSNTSGTTGTSLTLWHTPEALAEEYAIAWRMYRSRNVGLKDPRLTFGGNLVIPYEVDSPPFWRFNRYGRQILFSAYHMKPENLGIYVTAIHEMPARWAQGYPSVLFLMARALLDAGRPLPRGRLAGVFTSSERLLASHREIIEAGFNAPVVDRYGTSEFAVSITSCELNRMHVDMEFCIVEVEPIEEDEESVRGSLLVTGLSPDALPFFRYRIGDIGTLSKNPCPCGRPGDVFLGIEGRDDDFVMTPDGRLVGRLDHIFKGQDQVSEAQILQSTKDAITVLLVPRHGYGEDAERGLLAEIHARLGSEIDVRIETTDRIPRDANGKFRAVKSALGHLPQRQNADHAHSGP